MNYYEVDLSTQPPSCLPTGLNRDNLKDITAIGKSWKVYFNTKTGTVHDGEEYYRMYMEEIK